MPQPRKHDSDALKQAAYRHRRAAAHEEQLRSKGLPALPTPAAIPGRVRWRAAIESAGALIEQTATEMQDYFDERSESWQESSRGEEHQERIASVEAVLEVLEDLIP